LLRITPTHHASLRAGELVVTESPGPSLDHNGALRSLLACDHARRGARGATCHLLYFRSYLLDRQPHQRSGDLGLSLLVIGDAGGGKNGFIQCWRVAPDP